MKIGDIELGERPIFLAPMEDVTDIGFRWLPHAMQAVWSLYGLYRVCQCRSLSTRC